MLHVPLSDGQFSFVSGIVYELSSYSDMLRLTSNGDFEEVTEKGEKVVPPGPSKKPVVKPLEVVPAETPGDSK